MRGRAADELVELFERIASVRAAYLDYLLPREVVLAQAIDWKLGEPGSSTGLLLAHYGDSTTPIWTTTVSQGTQRPPRLDPPRNKWVIDRVGIRNGTSRLFRANCPRLVLPRSTDPSAVSSMPVYAVSDSVASYETFGQAASCYIESPDRPRMPSESWPQPDFPARFQLMLGHTTSGAGDNPDMRTGHCALRS